METHGFRSTPVQSISSLQGTVTDNGLSQQFGFLFDYFHIVKFAFLLNLDIVPSARYLFDSGHRTFIALFQGVTAQCTEIPYGATRMAVKNNRKTRTRF